MNTFLLILSFIGALALFLYGMKTMSEGLEKIAGNKMREILGTMTKNRFTGVLTGLSVTALIQSSSATTVMVVSFVNAGLMTLAQAISVIMGANIGTTITAWIVSFIGFKVSISVLALPLLAIALPLIFSKRTDWKNWGEFVVGFSFLFMGLKMLSDTAQALHIGEHMADVMALLPCDRFWVIPVLALCGTCLTIAMQSSSASMAITLMLFDMNIPGFGFTQAAALVLGQEIGTTITALLASMAGNTQAKQAALAHTAFNVIGVILALIFFYPFCSTVQALTELIFGQDVGNMYRLSAFHTCFNLAGTLLMIGFVSQLEQVVTFILPDRSRQGAQHLKYISAGLLSTAELSILQAQKEISCFAERCHRMVGMAHDLVVTDSAKEMISIYHRIEKYEQITDRMEVEIADYLVKVSEGRLSATAKESIRRMLRQIDELESIGDSCFNLARTLQHQQSTSKEFFLPEQKKNMLAMVDLCDQAMGYMEEVLMMDPDQVQPTIILRSQQIERRIDATRARLKENNLQDVDKGLYSYQQGVFYSDFIAHAEKMGDHIVNVVETFLSPSLTTA